MAFWRRYWYYIGGVIFVALAFFLALWGCDHLSRMQVVLLLSWMAMLIHQFEEYALPGGFPLIANMVMLGEIDHPASRPLNSLGCWIDNVFFCYTAYLILVFFPDLIWLAASQVFAGVWQLLGHGLLLNRKLKSLYSPGLGACVFLHAPLAVYFVWLVCTTQPDRAWQLLPGIPSALVFLGLVFGLPVVIMHRSQGEHPFEDRELYGFKADFVRQTLADRRAEQEEGKC